MKEVKSWSDITVGQYQEIMMVESENEIRRFIEQVAIILDCDPEDIRNMPISEYSKLQQNMAFIKEDPEHTVVDRFEINGVKYGLEPDMNLITAGVFLDSEQFKQDATANLHNTLALIYRPITKEEGEVYEIEAHQSKGFERRAQIFKDELTIDVVLGTVLFFSIVGTGLSTAFLESFIQEATIQEPQTKTKTTRTRMKKPKH